MKTLGAIVMIMLFECGIYFHLSSLNPPMFYADNILTVNDFAYHLFLFKNLWINHSDIYLPEQQLQALSNYFSTNVAFSMPVGMTPVAAILWLPLMFLGENYLVYGYVIWMTASLTLFGFGIYKSWVMLSAKREYLLITLLIFASSAALARVNATGQTTLFAVGLLTYLYFLLGRGTSNKLSWRIVITLVLLSIKPYYCLVAYPLVLVGGSVLECVIAAAIVVSSFIGLSLYLHSNLFSSYLSGLSVYSQISLFPQYNGALHLDSVYTLRGLLYPVFGEGVSFAICNILLGISVLLFLYIGLRIRKTNKQSARQVCLVGTTGAVLLFSPYLGIYEDILLIPAFYFAAFGANPIRLSLNYFVVLSLLLLLVLNYAYFMQSEYLPLFIACKGAMFIFLLTVRKIPSKL